MLNYTEKPQNTYIQSSMFMDRENCGLFGVCVLYPICDVILSVSEGWAPSTIITFPRYR